MRGITENTIRDIYSYIEKVIRKNVRYEISFHDIYSYIENLIRKNARYEISLKEVLDIERSKMKA